MSAFIVSDQEAISTRVRDILTFGGRDCPSSHTLPVDGSAVRLGREPGVDLIILALPSDRERGMLGLTGLARVAPGKVLVVGPSNDAKIVLRSLRGGAADYIDVADLEVELESALGRMKEATTVAVEPGKVIAVLSPSGGGGSSTVSANLAASLAKEHQRCGLVDLKLEAGDLSALLDLQPTFTLADLCQNASRLDRLMFERSLVQHVSGIHLLASPQSLADVPHVTPEGVGHALSLARLSFPYVVVDLDHSFRQEQVAVMSQADVILVVFRLDFMSLRNVRRALEHLEVLDVAADAIRLVVNRYGQPQEVPVAKAEEALRRKVAHFLPEDAKAVNRANNHGVPVIFSAPKAKIARSLGQLATSVNGRPKK